jgi:type VI secretion system secreted protein Hcp
MAVDMIMKIDGIDGESKIKDHEDEIDVLAWSWGMSQAGSFHSGGGGGAGKASVQDLSFTKWVDKSTHALMLHCCNGAHIDNIALVVRKAGKDALDFLKIDMEKCIVTSVSTGGSGGEERLTENVTINFAKVVVEYQLQKDDGSGEAGGDFTWNIEQNVQE